MTPLDEPRYGVTVVDAAPDEASRAAEELRRLGYTVVGSGYDQTALDEISAGFDAGRARYIERFGADDLKSVDEFNGIRLPMLFDDTFFGVAMNELVLRIVGQLIAGKFLLNQQNGVINPAGESYNQGAWHRDLPYQHFVSSRPLVLNALFCVDEFTEDNGATWVLPASHLQEAFPSAPFVEQHKRQVTAPRGSFVILDGMTFHRGGENRSALPRRAVNHLYAIPHIRQQIDMPRALDDRVQDSALRALLGYGQAMPASVEDYLATRIRTKDVT